MQQKNLNKVTFASFLVTIGIVFGDIGTSPLYTMNAILFLNDFYVTEELVYGSASLIFWTLTILTTFKYVGILLRADNHGEGGIFALYTKVKGRRRWLAYIAMIGAAALIADGMITPALTVTSAIEGLHDVIEISQQQIMAIAIIIIVILFLFQQFGTHKLGSLFGPIMLTWFGTLFVFGILQILDNPQIVAALNPIYAIKFLFTNPVGIFILGAVFLCSTGAEALYSDLGHVGRKNIYVAWTFVKICLVVNYFGQAAHLLNYTGQVIDFNPFFGIIPDVMTLPVIIIATLAAIIASQALISGAFTLVSEGIQLGFLPRLKILYSSEIKGRMYIPKVNYFLMTGAISVVLIFQSSTHMEAAYGLSIVIAMLMTSTLLFFYLRKYYRRFAIPYIVTGFIMGFEMLILAANVGKFIQGGWITFLIMCTVFFVMIVWFQTDIIKRKYRDLVPIKNYLTNFEKLRLDETQPKFATNLVFTTSYKTRDRFDARIANSIFNGNPKRADNYFIVNIKISNDPYEACYKVTSYSKTVHKVDLRLGFKVEPKLDLYMKTILDSLESENRTNPCVDHSLDLTKNNREIFKAKDIHYIVHQDDYSQEMHLPTFEDIILRSKPVVNLLASSHKDFFTIHNSSITVEKTLILAPLSYQKLQRECPADEYFKKRYKSALIDAQKGGTSNESKILKRKQENPKE